MPHHHGTSGSWEISIVLTLLCVCVVLLYLRGWLRLTAKVPAWRALSFVLGLLFIWIAVASPIAALDHELLTVHMIQHLLLMTLAPPLIWLGGPVMVYAAGNLVVLRWPFLQRLGKVFTRPAFCLLAASGVLVVWHIPAAFALGMQSLVWQMVEHASFLVAGLLFWWPVVRPWPSLPRPQLSLVLYLFFATLPCDILSGFLVFCDRVVYPAYLSSSHLFGFSALGDQQCAAALMWTCVTVVYLIAGVILTMQMLSPHSSREVEALQAGTVLEVII